MEHLYRYDNVRDAAPVGAHGWAVEDATKRGEIQTGIRYKKTRSTLAVDAFEVYGLQGEYAVAAFETLIHLCKIADRDEIVVEGLDSVASDENDQSVCDCFNSMQSDIMRTCRKMNLCPPRLSLEKRRQHFDLRIYPAFA
jgi:hypothetical protein